MADIVDSLIIAEPIEGGFTYTLASRLGDLLKLAEEKFGPRKPDFTILGVEFQDGDPQTWFPGNCKHIVVQLSLEAMNNEEQAVFQLAHETVHLLDGGQLANVLEEGVAVNFQQEYMLANFENSISIVNPKYIAAGELVERLLTFDNSVVKRLRSICGSFDSITAKHIAIESNLPIEICECLAMPFDEYNPQA